MVEHAPFSAEIDPAHARFSFHFGSGTATATTASLTVRFPNGPGPGSSCAPKVFPVMTLLGACRNEIWHALVR